MRCNVALWDRGLRFVVGVLLTAFAIAGGPFWAYIGIIFLMTSAWGFCPVYAFFKVRTLKLPPRRTEPADENE
jgi:hypothetical protein